MVCLHRLLMMPMMMLMYGAIKNEEEEKRKARFNWGGDTYSEGGKETIRKKWFEQTQKSRVFDRKRCLGLFLLKRKRK